MTRLRFSRHFLNLMLPDFGHGGTLSAHVRVPPRFERRRVVLPIGTHPARIATAGYSAFDYRLGFRV
jgi:hypothetical protein